ncbi:Domain of unknown function DUF1828 [Methanohalobium evestigatum Z-7303]|uniref:DUF1828 domain-containing protein n=1 Tax=Methanohalobium evestigatum (strain ATCC BAA-1072 / DSM 3721 / NBRC 107634 / OCM 161 / Z-7303) TaxID=644295 RepID=D7E6U7_METEZ|nr:DUF1828 domain-containing protein [Methanohalobium evestigatum]ADI73571.1 Domain of unknown function DUF1828 [Methanohalobium evestigatum Z-7303]
MNQSDTLELEPIVNKIKKSICDDIEVIIEGKSRIVVITPFTFDDGDFLNVVLKYDYPYWYFTDEGDTLMHLSYDDLDEKLEKGKRKDMFDTILKTHDIKNKDGELKLNVDDEKFGDCYFTFIQGLVKIIDLSSFTKKDNIKTLFYEEFKKYMQDTFGEKCKFEYTDPVYDPDGKYVIDCYVENKVPLFVFGLYNDDKCRDATITCHFYREKGITYNSIAIFEDQEKINKKVLARFSDVVDKQYTTLPSAKSQLPEYLEKMGMNVN